MMSPRKESNHVNVTLAELQPHPPRVTILRHLCEGRFHTIHYSKTSPGQQSLDMALEPPATTGVLPVNTPGAWIATITLLSLLPILIYTEPTFLPPRYRTPAKLMLYGSVNVILVACLPQTNILEFGVNAGLVATGNLPGLLLLVLRKMRTPKQDFASTIVYHRWIGRIITGLSLLHGLTFLGDPNRPSAKTTSLIAANIAFAALVVLTTFSHSIFRRKQFELFYYTHFLYLFYIIGAAVHQPLIAIYIAPPMALYMADKLYGKYMTYRNAAIVRDILILPHNVIRLTFSCATFKYKAGQFAWFQFPHIGAQWHPFTISSYPQDKYITINIKGLGGYTKKFIEMVGSDKALNLAEFPIFIDGPYGATSVDFRQHSHVVLFAGGIGITPLISQIGDLLESSALKEIRLIWAIQEEDQYEWFSEELVRLHAKHQGKLILEVYLTRRAPSAEFFLAGRPKIDNIIRGLVRSGHWGVGVCGSDSLMADVNYAAYKHSTKECKFYVHNETFTL